MTIRTRLVLSYLVIILGLSVGVLIVTHLLVTRRMARRHLEAAEQAVRSVTEHSYELSREILTAFGERHVRLEARTTADQLSTLLSTRPRPFDYDALRRDREIRRIATHNVVAWDRIAGYVDLLDRTGVAVIHPNPGFEGSSFRAMAKQYPEMWDLVERSFTEDGVAGYYTFPDPHGGPPVRKFMALARVRGTPFIATAAVTIRDYFGPAHELIGRSERDELRRAEQQIEGQTGRYFRRAGAFVLIVALLQSAVGIWLAIRFSRAITAPISSLVEGVRQLGDGRFDVRVDETGPPETAELARSFNSLGGRLTAYVDSLQRETAAREEVESEIRVTRKLQESLVPRTFPPFPDRTEFSVYAQLLPAREVAGDFYDFFFVEDNVLAVVIADVSGKSVPAAFFMAMTRTLVRWACSRYADPADAVRFTNEILCRDNAASMFVTLFLGYYDVVTGRLLYANAGHHQAYRIARPGGGGATVRPFGLLADPAVGFLPGHDYRTGVEPLDPGEVLVLFTDGITEAVSPGDDGEMYGAERWGAFLETVAGEDPESVCRRAAAEIDRFQGGARFDDVTLLALRRAGGAATEA